MGFEALKVGELARRTRLTIRTLHHYDEIGLLRPSLYTGSGHRLYTAGDVARLQQVVSLRQLGFSLEAWQELLAQLKVEMDSGTDPADPKVQALEKRRQVLVSAFSGGDKAIEENLKRMWTEQGDKLCAQFGIDPKLMAYLGKAADAAS